jgi:ParB/RepB/Spo0J family partition protein
MDRERREKEMSETEFTMIPIDLLLYSGRNPRTEMRGLEELAENIKEYGVLEPVILRPKEGKFEIIVGERRVRASIIAGLNEIPSIVKVITDRQADELRLIENIHREDLTTPEKGDAVLGLVENYPEKYPTFKSVADSLNIPYGSIKDWCLTSRKLSPFIREVLGFNTLTEDVARYVMKYEHGIQDRLAKCVIEHKLAGESVRKFFRMYNENPLADLDALAEEARGAKTVRISLEKLPEEIRKEVEKVAIPEYVRKPKTQEVKKKIRETLRETRERVKKARERKAMTPEVLQSTTLQEVPREDILKKTEAIIERLDEIKHPYQRERMVEVVPKELERLEKRLQKAPERRERVEHKLNRLYELQAEGIFLSTLWAIGERVEYAGSKDFHGNCPPQVVEQCVLRLSKKGDVVLDPMAGSGTAIDVCNLLDRKCVAYDLKPPEWRSDIIRNDGRKIPLGDNAVDMIFLHPPYWDMVYYTENENEEKLSDLSRASTLEEYLCMLKSVLQECFRVLKPNKYLCILLGDRIKEGKFIPLCRKTANLSEGAGFTDCGYAVKFTSGSTSSEVKGQMIYAELAYTENLKVEHDLVMFFRKEE